MQIANPIYDAVFKYMMNDNKVAKLLLSAILGEEIIELDFRPTEVNISLKETLTVLRMDFSALVQYQNGERQLIILEVQKAKLHTDIMRFRRYLGEQYRNDINAVKIKTKLGKQRKKAFPIISIYFLGHTLDNAKDIPIVKVARQYINHSTGEILKEKEEFIESLTHDSYIIQVPYLRGKRRTELEQVLSIFDQSNLNQNFHILNVKEENLPEKYHPIVRRLIMAISDVQLRNQMKAEDDIIEEFRDYIHALREKELELQEKEKEIQSKDEEIQSKDEEIQSKDEEIQGINEILRKTIITLYKNGTSAFKMSRITGLPMNEIQKIIDSQ